MNYVLDAGIVLSVISIVGICYPHVLYPLFLRLLRIIRSEKPVGRIQDLPSITVIIATYNEESIIGDTLQRLLNSDYPSDRMRVMIADDGSSDDTVRIIQSIAENDSRLLLLQCERRGKNNAVSQAISFIATDVVVFMDADTFVDTSTLQALVSRFSHPDVGAVVSVITSVQPGGGSDSGNHGDSVYRRFENITNILESDIHSTVSSNGALYAVRQEFAAPIRSNLAADDFVPLLRTMKAGKRVVIEPTALVFEGRQNNIRTEVRRTRRTVAGGMAAVWAQRSLLLPSAGWPAFFLWSHRIARWMSPFFLILLLFSTFLTVSDPLIFGILYYGQCTVYGAALLSRVSSRMEMHIPVIWVAEFFVAMNIAMFLGFLSFLQQRPLDTWTPGAS